MKNKNETVKLSILKWKVNVRNYKITNCFNILIILGIVALSGCKIGYYPAPTMDRDLIYNKSILALSDNANLLVKLNINNTDSFLFCYNQLISTPWAICLAVDYDSTQDRLCENIDLYDYIVQKKILNVNSKTAENLVKDALFVIPRINKKISRKEVNGVLKIFKANNSIANRRIQEGTPNFFDVISILMDKGYIFYLTDSYITILKRPKFI